IELNKILREIEIYYLKRALEIARGTKTKAAKLLGLNRTTFIEKLKKYNHYINKPKNYPVCTRARNKNKLHNSTNQYTTNRTAD
ncbi:MAG: helix-turn-helix domain-containing protein, partial [Thermoprotei archaeon]